MSDDSFAEHLSGLDEASLASMLALRPDVRLQPVPRGFHRLAQRLGGADSLSAAMQTLNRDALVAGQAIAVLGVSATNVAVAALLNASERVLTEAVAQLRDLGLVWTRSGRLYLSERLEEHWSAEIGGGRPISKIARAVAVDDLRLAAEALGVKTTGLRKPELSAGLSAALADARSLATAIAGLSQPARGRLVELRHGYQDFYASSYPGYGGHRPQGLDGSTRQLIAAGLVFEVNRRPELPREVAVAAWLAEDDITLTGRPEIAHADVDAAAVRSTAQAAVQEALRGVTTLLDHALMSPIAALKKGGVGPRERAQLAKRLSIPADVLVLWIDLAYAVDLLGEVEAGYAPTDAYSAWRDAEPGRRWAVLADGWLGLEHAPLNREIDGEKELPPPIPLLSGAGRMRRALLREARSGAAVRAVCAQLDWFVPLHGYPAVHRDEKLAAVTREAELLGVIAADRLSELGEQLADVAQAATDDAVAELAERCAPLLPESDCAVIVQSDLTAVVSGQPSAAVAGLLAACAVAESRGAAGVWRFTPDSIRGALDAGWSAAGLLAKLNDVSGCALPQPLEYLISDAARRHGQVRVRGVRCCVVSDESVIAELLHTRSLAKLRLRQLAPTVLSSQCEPDEVLARLRQAGLSPVLTDDSGEVVVMARAEHRAARFEPAARTLRSALTAAELAKQLRADPDGESARDGIGSETLQALERLNRHLDDAELELLADAVDRQVDVLIAYRDANGTHTVRQIAPQRLYGKWLDSWCHLRSGQRDFTVANIERVAPVG